MLVFAICMTPTAMYADYVRAIPSTYSTLIVWLLIAVSHLIWGVAMWLHLERTSLAMSLDNPSWYKCVFVVSFIVALYLSRVIYSWINYRK